VQPPVLTEVVDKVGIITLNRPERRNAVNGPLAAGLDAAVKAMAADDGVKVVVLTGAAPEGGTGGFCSGGDTKMSRDEREGMELAVPDDALDGDLARHDGHAAMFLHCMPKPTIAMVGGPAVGAGCSLAAACDLRFAADDAVFSTGFLANGLAGDYGGSFFWTRIGGTALARRLYLLSEKISAPRALELGMVHEVVPAAELRAYTMEIAGRLAHAPPEVVAAVKDDLNQAEDTIERRRELFAIESVNQRESSRLLVERVRQRSQERGG
jgi:2-(1,2-epoxy-1,2-dihydrophenyl)acetyl-CoA isomerase